MRKKNGDEVRGAWPLRRGKEGLRWGMWMVKGNGVCCDRWNGMRKGVRTLVIVDVDRGKGMLDGGGWGGRGLKRAFVRGRGGRVGERGGRGFIGLGLVAVRRGSGGFFGWWFGSG